MSVILRLDRGIQSRKLSGLKTLDSRLRENDKLFYQNRTLWIDSK